MAAVCFFRGAGRRPAFGLDWQVGDLLHILATIRQAIVEGMIIGGRDGLVVLASRDELQGAGVNQGRIIENPVPGTLVDAHVG